MSFKRTLLKTTYKLGVFNPFHWANRANVLILTYHRFSPSKEAYRVSSSEFSAHLEYLRRHNNVVSLSKAVRNLTSGEPLPPNTVVITIDDGYRDAFDVALPTLKKFGLPATLFVITDFLDGRCWLWTDLLRYVFLNTRLDSIDLELTDGERIRAELQDRAQRIEVANRINSHLKRLPNREKDESIEQIAHELGVSIPSSPTAEYAPISWEQAHEMEANNLQIESHTVSHPILTNIDEPDLDFELQASKERLEAVLNKEVQHFCYPNGAVDDSVRRSVEKAGYKSAVTTAYGFNKGHVDRFLLNRIDGQAEIEKFAQSVSGFELTKQKLQMN